MTRTYRIIELSIALDCDGFPGASVLYDAWRGFASTGPADHYLRIASTEAGWSLSLDDDEQWVVEQAPDRCYVTALWVLNREIAAASARRWLLLHGAAAGIDGRVGIFSGASESGKSTLVTALVDAGFTYYTDEFVAVDRATGLVQPVPKHIALDDGSWPLFPELRSLLHPDSDTYSPTQWQLDVARWRPEQVAQDAAAPAAYFSIRYVPGSPTVLTPTTRADAMLTLADQTFAWPAQPATNLRDLAGLAARLDCYRLEYSDLADAVATIRRCLTADRAGTLVARSPACSSATHPFGSAEQSG